MHTGNRENVSHKKHYRYRIPTIASVCSAFGTSWARSRFRYLVVVSSDLCSRASAIRLASVPAISCTTAKVWRRARGARPTVADCRQSPTCSTCLLPCCGPVALSTFSLHRDLPSFILPRDIYLGAFHLHFNPIVEGRQSSIRVHTSIKPVISQHREVGGHGERKPGTGARARSTRAA